MAVVIGVAVATFALAFAVGASGLFAGGGGPAQRTVGAPASSTAPTTAVPSTSVPPAASAPPSSSRALSALPTDRSYAVGTRSITFVDPSRPTSANGDFPGAPTRTLPTEFWYPAAGATGAPAQPDATPDRTHGPYPLVLFSHGYDVTPDFYSALLARWAAAGYVVAAPTYPILSGTPGGASHVDYTQTFGDATFVISKVLTLPAGDALAGLIDPARIAAAGHSDGEVIAFAQGFLQCCRDPRIRSVIAMAGDLSNANNPMVQNSGTPILHIMETGDEYDPYEHSIDWDRENLTAPRWMLTLNSTHVPPYTQSGDPAFELVSRATIDYLNGTLKGSPSQLEQMTADVAAAPSVATLER